MTTKTLTLTERRRRIRRAREQLSVAMIFMQPDNKHGHKRDMDKSDALIGKATLTLETLCNDIAASYPRGAS